jgi:hypothetical protein
MCSIGLGSATVDSASLGSALNLFNALKQRDPSLDVPFQNGRQPRLKLSQPSGNQRRACIARPWMVFYKGVLLTRPVSIRSRWWTMIRSTSMNHKEKDVENNQVRYYFFCYCTGFIGSNAWCVFG